MDPVNAELAGTARSKPDNKLKPLPDWKEDFYKYSEIFSRNKAAMRSDFTGGTKHPSLGLCYRLIQERKRD